MSIKLPILAFNDVYRVSQRFVPQPGSPSDPSSSKTGGQISVSQFGELLLSRRAAWSTREGGLSENQDADGDMDGEGEKDGLVLFAGDVFNPSVESSVTRGSHMVSLEYLSASTSKLIRPDEIRADSLLHGIF